MLSVLCPSIRPDRIDIVAKALQKQTLEDFEFLIGSEVNPNIQWAKWVKDDFDGGFWSLNRIMNKLIKESRGEIIISLQDSISILPDGLQMFFDDIVATNYRGIISGVGDQYSKIDNYNKPYDKCWSDPRKTLKNGTFYECTFPDIEWNWCAIPKQALIDVGGFDEKLDFLGFGMDGYQVNERLNNLGYKFYLDQTNESYSYKHDRLHGDEWNKNNNLTNGNYERRRQELIDQKKWPRLNYLKS